MQQKGTIGGILSIVAGAFGVISGLLLLVVVLFFSSVFNDPAFYDGTFNPDEFTAFFVTVYGAAAVFCLALGVLGIVGGIFGIQRKYWGWALAGAISGCISFLPVGVAAVVFIAMGKSEFGAPMNPVPPPPQPVNPV